MTLSLQIAYGIPERLLETPRKVTNVTCVSEPPFFHYSTFNNYIDLSFDFGRELCTFRRNKKNILILSFSKSAGVESLYSLQKAGQSG